MQADGTKNQPHLTYQITTYYQVEPLGSEHGSIWLAVATAHVYDADPNPGLLTPETAILAGAVMKVVSGRGTGGTEASAIQSALDVLAIQVKSHKSAPGDLADSHS